MGETRDEKRDGAVRHSPLPWTVLTDGRTIFDAVCSTVATCNWDGDAQLICKSVNNRHLNGEMTERLYDQREMFRKKLMIVTKERDKLLEDNEKISCLARRVCNQLVYQAKAAQHFPKDESCRRIVRTVNDLMGEAIALLGVCKGCDEVRTGCGEAKEEVAE